MLLWGGNAGLFNCIAFPFADPLGKGRRAAGDIRFTMVWSMVTTRKEYQLIEN